MDEINFTTGNQFFRKACKLGYFNHPRILHFSFDGGMTANVFHRAPSDLYLGFFLSKRLHILKTAVSLLYIGI